MIPQKIKDEISKFCKEYHESNGPKNISIEEIVRSWLDELGITYKLQEENIITNKNIVININRCYQHSDSCVSKKYHINKFTEYRDNNIQLIQLWEDWIIRKPEIVKSMLVSKLGVCDNAIYARCCKVRELDYKTAMQFLEENHIQGKCSSNFRIGLVYKENLVAVMCFDKRSGVSGSKNINSTEAELIRFCNLRYTRVIGGVSKLLQYYINKFNPSIITSYSANDISNGGLYKALGFESDNKISESYWYIEPKTFNRYHRSIFTRSGIVRKWSCLDINDKSWTERIIMNDMGYMRIYDSGTTRWMKRVEKIEN